MPCACARGGVAVGGGDWGPARVTGERESLWDLSILVPGHRCPAVATRLAWAHPLWGWGLGAPAACALGLALGLPISFSYS